MRLCWPLKAGIFLLPVMLSACGSGMKVKKAELKPIPPGFSGTFQEQPYRSEGRNAQDSSLLALFDLSAPSADTVALAIGADGQLHLSFTNGVGRWAEHFEGRFSKRGYFEVYTLKDIKEVPPVVPIVHGRRTVNRVRLMLSAEGALIVDNKWERTANIFIMAGGGSGRSQHFFRAAGAER